MSHAQMPQQPKVRPQKPERLDYKGPPDEWANVDHVVQQELALFDVSILAALPTIRVREGSNHGRSWKLFSYRVYQPPEGGIDSVVIGIRFAASGRDGGIEVHGDITGETLGDILLDLPLRHVTGQSSVADSVREVCQQLTGGLRLVIAALQDRSRRT